jgi:hypothetical protein
MAKIRKNQPPLFDYSKINQYIPWYMDYMNSTNNQNQNSMNYWNNIMTPQDQQGLWDAQQRNFDLMNQDKYLNELNQYIQQGSNASGTKSPRRKDETGFVSMYYKQPKTPVSSFDDTTRLVTKRKKPRQR